MAAIFRMKPLSCKNALHEIDKWLQFFGSGFERVKMVSWNPKEPSPVKMRARRMAAIFQIRVRASQNGVLDGWSSFFRRVLFGRKDV